MKLTQSMRDAFVRAAMADVPQVDYHAQVVKIVLAAAEKRLPPKVRAIWKDKELSHFVKTDRGHFANFYITYPGEFFRLDLEDMVAVDKIRLLSDAQDETNSDLRRQLRAATLAFSTRKALAEALPEFEKYLPEDAVKANRSVPTVTNVVSDFVKAGWPVKAKK